MNLVGSVAVTAMLWCSMPTSAAPNQGDDFMIIESYNGIHTIRAPHEEGLNNAGNLLRTAITVTVLNEPIVLSGSTITKIARTTIYNCTTKVTLVKDMTMYGPKDEVLSLQPIMRERFGDTKQAKLEFNFICTATERGERKQT